MRAEQLGAFRTADAVVVRVLVDDSKRWPDPDSVVRVAGNAAALESLLAALPEGAAVLSSGPDAAIIHVDATRTVPDPEYVREYRFGLDVSSEEIAREVQAHIRSAQAKLSASAPVEMDFVASR